MSKKKQQLSDQERLHEAYATTFKSQAGKKVLVDLQKMWRERSTQINTEILQYAEGRRSVIDDIEKKIKFGEKIK